MTVSLSSVAYTVSEGDGVANVSLELIRAAEREVTVLIQPGDITATGSSEEWPEVAAGLMYCSPFSYQ